MTAKDVGSGALFGAAGTLTTEYPRRKRRTIAVILLRSVRLSLVAEVFGGGYLRSTLPRSSFLCFSRRSPASEILGSRQTLALDFFWSLRGESSKQTAVDTSRLVGSCDSSGQLLLKVRVLELLPNVKDEPRPSPARLVQHYDLDSVASCRSNLR